MTDKLGGLDFLVCFLSYNKKKPLYDHSFWMKTTIKQQSEGTENNTNNFLIFNLNLAIFKKPLGNAAL